MVGIEMASRSEGSRATFAPLPNDIRVTVTPRPACPFLVRRLNTQMSFLSIAWRVLVNLATGAVILAMFGLARSPFESAVVSALVLIYIAVASSHMSLGYAMSKKWNIDLARYIAIARSLHLNTEIEEAAQTENQDAERKGQPAFWIEVSFKTVFCLIALWQLLAAIGSPGV